MLEAYLRSPFYRALEPALAERGIELADLCPQDDVVARRVLHDYGAMFVACDSVSPPPVCVFTCDDEVARFRDLLSSRGCGDDVAEVLAGRLLNSLAHYGTKVVLGLPAGDVVITAQEGSEVIGRALPTNDRAPGG